MEQKNHTTLQLITLLGIHHLVGHLFTRIDLVSSTARRALGIKNHWTATNTKRGAEALNGQKPDHTDRLIEQLAYGGLPIPGREPSRAELGPSQPLARPARAEPVRANCSGEPDSQARPELCAGSVQLGSSCACTVHCTSVCRLVLICAN